MIYESVIKFPVPSSDGEKARAIIEGLSYAVLLLIDECGLSLTAVEDALDEARQTAEDEWYNLHPSEPEDAPC